MQTGMHKEACAQLPQKSWVMAAQLRQQLSFQYQLGTEKTDLCLSHGGTRCIQLPYRLIKSLSLQPCQRLHKSNLSQ